MCGGGDGERKGDTAKLVRPTRQWGEGGRTGARGRWEDGDRTAHTAAGTTSATGEDRWLSRFSSKPLRLPLPLALPSADMEGAAVAAATGDDIMPTPAPLRRGVFVPAVLTPLSLLDRAWDTSGESDRPRDDTGEEVLEGGPTLEGRLPPTPGTPPTAGPPGPPRTPLTLPLALPLPVPVPAPVPVGIPNPMPPAELSSASRVEPRPSLLLLAWRWRRWGRGGACCAAAACACCCCCRAESRRSGWAAKATRQAASTSTYLPHSAGTIRRTQVGGINH